MTKRFGVRAAFEELSFELGWGEIFGLLGPNGAGKTTAVRVLSTLLPRTAGSAEVAGIPLVAGNEREIRRRVGVVTDQPGLYLKLTVRDNLEFFAGLYGLPARRAHKRIEECAAAVGIADRLEDRAGALSRGLLQRAGLARALLPDPQLLFLDEPTTGLDPAAAAGVRQIVSGLRSRGATVFLTTHRLDEAEAMCDRVAIVRTRLVSVGTPAELKERAAPPSFELRVATPLRDPAALFGAVEGVHGWRNGGVAGRYVIEVGDVHEVAPRVARAVVEGGGSLLSLAEVETSLEEAYLGIVEAER